MNKNNKNNNNNTNLDHNDIYFNYDFLNNVGKKMLILHGNTNGFIG